MKKFDKVAGHYDNFMKLFAFDKSDEIKDALMLRGDEIVVDVGGGTGKLAEVMADNCQTIYVLDESKGMLAKVKQNSKVKPIIGDALNTNFEKESIDIVTMVDSLHHIDNHPELMKEMHRILKVGGKILILDLEREDIRIKLLKIFEFFLFGKLNYRTSKEVITLLSEKFNVIKHIDKKYYYFILAEKPDLD